MISESSHANIHEGVIRALRQSVPRPLATKPIESSHGLRTDLSIDSLGLITLVTLLEGEFDLQLSGHTGDLLRIQTVQELNDFIERLRNFGIPDLRSEFRICS